MSFFLKTRNRRLIFPALVLSVLGYSQWAYSYLFAYKRIYIDHHNKPAMIAILVIANSLQIICYVSWGLILYRGPGKMPFHVPPYNLSKYIAYGRKYHSDDSEAISKISTFASESDEFIKPPLIFDCDRNGLPYWCSECATLKVYRSHHSSICGRCIPMFDHYCSFVGCTISRNNYLIFWVYVWAMELTLLFTTITIIVYGALWRSLHASLIVLVVITGTFAILVGHLMCCLMIDIYFGETTIERLTRRRWASYEKKTPENEREFDYTAYVNVQHPTDENLRLVVPLLPTDKTHNNGILCTLKLWMTNPQNLKNAQEMSDFTYSMYCKGFIKDIHQRIENGECKIFSSDE